MNYSVSAKKNAQLFLITVAIMNTLIAFILYYFMKHNSLENLYISNTQLAKLELTDTNEHIKKEIEHYKFLLATLKGGDFFQSYMNSGLLNDELKISVGKIFVDSVKANKDIFQLRFIDKNGLENIRIDKNNDSIGLSSTLQDKSKRYYFEKTKSINENEYYISNLDLNVENGKIEIPYKPTIRVSTPVYKNKIFYGILIINYNASDLVNMIRNKYLFDVYYMDHNGNFLLHPNSKKSWSTQLNNNYKVEDEIPNIDLIIKNSFNDKNWIYYANKISITDNEFYIIYSIKKSVYLKELRKIKENIVMLFIIIFIVSIPVVIIGAYFQAFQMKILETLIDNIPFPIALKNSVGKFILVNDSLVKLYGCAKKEDLIGKISYDFALNRLPHSDKRRDKITLNKKKLKFEHAVFLPNDRKLYFDTRLIKISFLGFFNKDFILGIAIDITELKSLNLELEKRVEEEVSNRIETEKQLAQKAKLAEMGNMIDNIIHQWKQPLSIISMSAQAIELDMDLGNFNEENTLEKVKIIKDNSNFMSRTADDFKAFLSPDKKLEIFALNDCIDSVERIISERIKRHEVNLIKNIDSDIELKGYKNEFSQVLMNFLNNAIDEFINEEKSFTKRDIQINAVKKDNKVNIIVKDSAGGIPQEYLDKIFEDRFTTKGDEGTGIGLSICRKIIVESFGGELIAYNEDAGAVFEITI